MSAVITPTRKTSSLEDPRTTEVVRNAADAAYRARVKSAVIRCLAENGLAVIINGKTVNGEPASKFNSLAARCREYGNIELQDKKREAGISPERWEALSTSTREAASPEEFQAFARVLGVSPRWLAIGAVDWVDAEGARGLIPTPAGWHAFGSHVDRTDLKLEFSTAVGEDGMPLWEREAA